MVVVRPRTIIWSFVALPIRPLVHPSYRRSFHSSTTTTTPPIDIHHHDIDPRRRRQRQPLGRVHGGSRRRCRGSGGSGISLSVHHHHHHPPTPILHIHTNYNRIHLRYWSDRPRNDELIHIRIIPYIMPNGYWDDPPPIRPLRHYGTRSNLVSTIVRRAMTTTTTTRGSNFGSRIPPSPSHRIWSDPTLSITCCK